MGHHGYMKPQLSGADVMLRTPSKLVVRPPRPPVILAVPAESRPSLWVPETSSTSCDQAIFVDQAADASLSSYAVLLKVDWFG
jgi:hypothetical protein